jgi:hypothetical protein
MRVLLDENLPRLICKRFAGHACRTVGECGWSGKKNGELLKLAAEEFDVLVTLDKSFPHQQNLALQRLALLIIRARSNRIQDLLPAIPACLAALASIQPGQIVTVGT